LILKKIKKIKIERAKGKYLKFQKRYLIDHPGVLEEIIDGFVHHKSKIKFCLIVEIEGSKTYPILSSI
jgi:hypothetical protein